MNFTNSEQALIEKAIQIIENKAHRGETLNNPTAIKSLLRLKISHLEHEVFTVIFLTTQLSLIACENMFRGTIDSSSVYPREVAKRALALNAASVVLAHNHPSGNITPSQADRAITERLQSALALIDIRVLDHVIVTADSSYSFAEQGLL